LYIGKKLYGIGEGNSLRKAKIECAKHALENLKDGKEAQREFNKDGLMEYLR